MFKVTNLTGLSNVLIDEANLEDGIQKTEADNLDILTSGTRSPNPAELLASDKMRSFVESLKDKYDYIIIDTPPVIMVTDAQILSKYADGCLLVIASEEADKNAAIKAKELLEKVNAKILGAVLNKLDTKRNKYYGCYYHYYYGRDRGKHVKKKVSPKTQEKS